MPKIIKNGREYSGTPLEEVTAWPPTGDSIQIEQPLMGSTDISEVGDGTVTGAIAQNAEDITELNNGLMQFGIVTGTVPSGNGETFNYPDGFTFENSYCLAFEINYNGGWRTGEGRGTANVRVFVSLESRGVFVFCTDSVLIGKAFRILLGKL